MLVLVKKKVHQNILMVLKINGQPKEFFTYLCNRIPRIWFLVQLLIFRSISELSSEHCQTSMIEFFCKNRQDSKYVFLFQVPSEKLSSIPRIE